MNTRSYLEGVKQKVLETLRSLQGAPGVQMQEVPPDTYFSESDDERDMDTRDKDNHAADNELFDDENDQ